MKTLLWILVWLVPGTLMLRAASNQETMSFDELAQAAGEWAQENIDPAALSAFDGIDRQKVEKLLRDLEKELNSRYVIDLATLKDSVRSILPLLQDHEETLPYAVWLKSQLDYLDVAERLRSKASEVKPPKPAANPTPAVQREIWQEQLAARDWPEGARAQVPGLRKVFTTEGVPQELVWIAEVESSFDSRARSPKGATGLFQLMPVTAQRFGLRTWPFDQRLKPEPSAKAAAQYLRVLYSRFKDWRLVLAAYNAGEGTVSRLLEKYKATKFDEIANYLPAETQMFVPRVEATVLRREGVTLVQLSAPRSLSAGSEG